MSGTIDFYFEFASPYSYLAAQRLPAVAARVGRSVRWRPIALAKIWAALGVYDAYRVVQGAKRGYMMADARRLADDLGVAFETPKRFPPDVKLARLAVHGLEARSPGLGGALALNIWRRFWAEGGGISTPEDLAAVAPDGLDPEAVLHAAADPASHDRLEAANAAAIASSCFGVPWLVADGEAYFGQDRLEMMARRLAR